MLKLAVAYLLALVIAAIPMITIVFALTMLDVNISLAPDEAKCLRVAWFWSCFALAAILVFRKKKPT